LTNDTVRPLDGNECSDASVVHRRIVWSELTAEQRPMSSRQTLRILGRPGHPAGLDTAGVRPIRDRIWPTGYCPASSAYRSSGGHCAASPEPHPTSQANDPGLSAERLKWLVLDPREVRPDSSPASPPRQRPGSTNVVSDPEPSDVHLEWVRVGQPLTGSGTAQERVLSGIYSVPARSSVAARRRWYVARRIEAGRCKADGITPARRDL